MLQQRGSKVALVPPPPIKFLDIGTKMGLYEVEGLIPDLKDRSNVLHPRVSSGIPVPGTFYEVMHEKLGKVRTGDKLWRDQNSWVKHSSNHDFHITDALGYIWGLLIIVRTCPRKLFEQGPRKNMWILSLTRCMPHPVISTNWHEIAAASLSTWEERDRQEPLLSALLDWWL